MYQFIERLHTLYKLLQDERSKEVFHARFACDMELSMPTVNRLASLRSNKVSPPYLGWPKPHEEELRKLNQERKKIILYGTAATGEEFARILEWQGIDFYGFCGRGAADYSPLGLRGKPVLTPDELVAHGDEYYVVLAVNTRKSYKEITRFLQEHNYPEEHILDWIDQASFYEEQYFEFPELYRRGTAFIDGGCLDCGSSYQFAKCCGGAYSSIIAFEPDPDNYARCREIIENDPLHDFQLVNAGLSSQEGTATFDAHNSSSSHIVSSSMPITENEITIRTAAIDDVVADRTVGFIKMDIQGAELDALQGARKTIVRDKPLLAICVYHLRGDLFAIMDYLHQLLPEYRFLLRHYSSRDGETVLYASVDL